MHVFSSVRSFPRRVRDVNSAVYQGSHLLQLLRRGRGVPVRCGFTHEGFSFLLKRRDKSSRDTFRDSVWISQSTSK